ncbi:hypothetical protein D3C83_193530 [compost metagenome]
MQKIWEIPETRKIPVVVLTADASQTVARRVTAAGAVECLAKPLNIPRLLGTIDQYLARNGDADSRA